jgi:hypothetical protein
MIKRTTERADALPSLNDFNNFRRWVAWEEVEGRKVPKDPANGRYAEVPTNPSTWGTRQEAVHRWQRIERANGAVVGGIGFVLGKIGLGITIAGIDLDGCLKDGAITDDVSRGVIERFDTYSEVSPNGEGVKLFFQASSGDVATICARHGINLRKTFSLDEHREIAFDTGRFYTNTGKSMGARKSLRLVSVDDLEWLIAVAGPRYLQGHSGGHSVGGDERDDSGSGYGRRFFRDHGGTYEKAREAILKWKGRAGDWARRVLKKDAKKGERELERAWEERDLGKRDRLNHSWDDPDQSLLDDRRGQLPDFPLEALRSHELEQAVQRAAHGKACSIDHVAVPLLAVASGLVGTARRVRATPAWSEPMTCWAGVIGASGTGKTPGLDVSRDALALIEAWRKLTVAKLRDAHDEKAEKAKVIMAQWRESLKSAIEDCREPPPKPEGADDPGKFVMPRLYVSNVTIERMAELLRVHPQGMLLVIDELAALFLNMRRYTRGQDNEFWLESWNGKSYVVERVGRSPIEVKHLLVGIVGGFQPEKLAASFKGDEDGMYARMLFGWPIEAPYQPLSNVAPEGVIVNALDRLVKLGGDDCEKFKPIDVPLRRDALAVLEALRKRVADERNAFEGRERDWWAKVPSHVMRLTGMLAYLAWATSGGDDEPVGVEPKEIAATFVEAAVTLVCDYFWPHSRAALRQVGLSDHHSKARRVLRWIKNQSKTEVLLLDIRADALARSLDADETLTLLEGLERAGWLRRHVDTRTGPGVRKARWEVNPKVMRV